MLSKHTKSFLTLVILIVAFFALSVFAVSADNNNNDHRVCFCHNVNNNPHTICTDNQGEINGHTNHVNNGTDTFGACQTNPTSTPTPTFTPTPTPNHHDDCDDHDHRDWWHHDDKCPTPTPTPTTEVSPTPTSTPTETVTPTPTNTPSSNPGGPGDGRSDGRSDGLSSCPSCTQAPQGQVLGASTGPAVLGLSTTSGEENYLLQFAQLFGALTSAGLGFTFFKKNA